jgi:hypothetical protein
LSVEFFSINSPPRPSLALFRQKKIRPRHPKPHSRLAIDVFSSSRVALIWVCLTPRLLNTFPSQIGPGKMCRIADIDAPVPGSIRRHSLVKDLGGQQALRTYLRSCAPRTNGAQPPSFPPRERHVFSNFSIWAVARRGPKPRNRMWISDLPPSLDRFISIDSNSSTHTPEHHVQFDAGECAASATPRQRTPRPRAPWHERHTPCSRN